MFERFTDRARRVLVLAQEEARLLNHNFIGTEHILLGLIHEGEGVAAKALGTLGISLEAVREKVEETIGPASESMSDSPPFTPRAKKVLELSLREALQLGHNYIGTEHMLLGLVREGEGVAAQVLQTLGADLSRVRQQVVTLLSGYPSGNQPSYDRAVKSGDAELTDIPVAASVLFSWNDAQELLLQGPLVANARTERARQDGVEYETCTYHPRPLPYISVTVAGASVSRAAFERSMNDWKTDARAVENLGDAAAYSPLDHSLRVLAGQLVFVVTIGHHANSEPIVIKIARRVLANLGEPPSPPAEEPPSLSLP
ncbi:MAG TPA: Clp protease N-terminal domain-containing protein [Acidimicrobiales bacterium]|nr:Clp protease N-terminal domain-containing protein [Acidimicrobiales bacterium]